MKTHIITILLLMSTWIMGAEIIEVDSLFYRITDGYAIVTNYPMYEPTRREYHGEIVIPGKIQYGGNYYSVKKIDFNAFRANTGLISVIIQDGIEEIDTLAFAQCDSLQAISLPSSLRIIHEAALSNCPNLLSISLPDSIVHIGAAAFVGCNRLEYAYLPQDYYQQDLIHYTVFSRCDQLKSAIMTSNTLWAVPHDYEGEFIVPDGITMIAAEAFHGCDKITKICLPESLIDIGDYAFSECPQLRSINLPNNVKAVGIGCFDHDVNLIGPIYNASIMAYLPASVGRHYSIPNGITQFCPSALPNQLQLRTLSIPEGVRVLPCDLLLKCPHLRKLKLPESVEFAWLYGRSHRHIREIRNSHLFAYLNPDIKGAFTIPFGTKVIAKQAFARCVFLDSISIPNTVDSIGAEAFAGCTRVRHLVIPGTVRTLGYDTFGGCDSLVSIRLDGSTPPTIMHSPFEELDDTPHGNERATLGLPADVLIIVPKGCIEVYKSTPGWSELTNYAEQ